jgi:hypothetical protein
MSEKEIKIKIAGNKGKDGKTPIKGVDYFTKKDVTEVADLARPKKGEDYFTKAEIDLILADLTARIPEPIQPDQVDYELLRSFIDTAISKIPEPEKIETLDLVQQVLELIQIPSETPETLADKINTLEDTIDYKVLKNAPNHEEDMDNLARRISSKTYDIEDIPGLRDELDASGVDGVAESFETVSKNLSSYDATLNFTGDDLTSIVYTAPGGNITKTFNYGGGNLTSIVLSGNTPGGIDLTKTLSYSGDDLSGIAYS